MNKKPNPSKQNLVTLRKSSISIQRLYDSKHKPALSSQKSFPWPELVRRGREWLRGEEIPSKSENLDFDISSNFHFDNVQCYYDIFVSDKCSLVVVMLPKNIPDCDCQLYSLTLATVDGLVRRTDGNWAGTTYKLPSLLCVSL